MPALTSQSEVSMPLVEKASTRSEVLPLSFVWVEQGEGEKVGCFSI